MNWIIENKAWLFSGLLVALPISIIGWLLASKKVKRQTQKSGNNSTNIQAGEDVKINIGEGK